MGKLNFASGYLLVGIFMLTSFHRGKCSRFREPDKHTYSSGIRQLAYAGHTTKPVYIYIKPDDIIQMSVNGHM